MAVIRGTVGADRLLGTNQDDIIRGLRGADDLIGRGGDDVLLGGKGDDFIDPGAGADLIRGGAGIDRLIYLGAAGGVTVDLGAGIALDGAGDQDRFVAIEEVQGSNFADVLLGSDRASFEQFIATSGNDEIDGGGGRDQVDYGNATGGIRADLGTGTIDDGFGSVDTVRNIEEIDGSYFDDVLIGRANNAVFEEFEGRRGDDIIDGGGARQGGIGLDEADYRGSPAGVVVDLASGRAEDGFGTVDQLSHIEAVDGSDFDDRLLGSNNVPGEVEFFTGHQGNDLIDGREGLDRVFYNREDGDQGVVVDLAAGTARDSFGGLDTLVRIEQANGTAAADTLLGDAGSNRFEGRDGDDRIVGRGGSDDLSGGPGSDQIVGGDGPDLLSGGGGSDELIGERGADTLLGGGGRDVLTGGGGADTLDGGAGSDVFRLVGLEGPPDVIRDFSLSDQIALVDVLQPDDDLTASVALVSDGPDALLQVDDGSGEFVTVARLVDQAGLSVDDLLASDAIVTA